MNDHPARSGLTLLELLLVLSIIAVVLGSGFGAFAALEPGVEQAAGVVKSVLHSGSRAGRDGARVRIDVAGERLWAESFRTVGTWHFEGDLRGALGLDGIGRDTDYVADGWVGRALALTGEGSSTVGIPVMQDPSFDPRLGFAIDCAVRRDGPGGGRVIDLGAAGDVRGRFTPADDTGGAVVLRSPPGLVEPGRWTRLGLRYDGTRFSLTIEGLVLDSLEVAGEVAALRGPLVLSDPAHPFAGALDALVVRMLSADEPSSLPDGVRFGADTPAEVVFDGGGRLSRARHSGPVVVRLIDRRGAERRVIVGVHGTVEG